MNEISAVHYYRFFNTFFTLSTVVSSTLKRKYLCTFCSVHLSLLTILTTIELFSSAGLLLWNLFPDELRRSGVWFC